jgi:hypothetical protein
MRLKESCLALKLLYHTGHGAYSIRHPRYTFVTLDLGSPNSALFDVAIWDCDAMLMDVALGILTTRRVLHEASQ